MMRLCYGVFFKLATLCKTRGVAEYKMCESILATTGASLYGFDKTKTSRLKTCTENPSAEIVERAGQCNITDVTSQFKTQVIPMLRSNATKQLVMALADVIRSDDSIFNDTLIGRTAGYTKRAIVEGNTFNLEEFLANVFIYVLLNTDNTSGKDTIKKIDDAYLQSFSSKTGEIFFETYTPDNMMPLSTTIMDKRFDFNFSLVSSVTINGGSRPSTAQIYQLSIRNERFELTGMKKLLSMNVGRYVYSRRKYSTIDEEELETIGVQALQLLKKYATVQNETGTILGEMLLYAFLEHALHAPKIMSKVELQFVGGQYKSESDGIHLLLAQTGTMIGNQLVFGTSYVSGGLHTAIDAAFDKILAIRNNDENELSMVDQTIFGFVYDDDTVRFMDSLLRPQKTGVSKPDMAFGIMLGYTMPEIDKSTSLSMAYKDMVTAQLRNDIAYCQEYIKSKISNLNLEGYSFYVYILPFNDAEDEKNRLVDDILEGRIN